MIKTIKVHEDEFSCSEVLIGDKCVTFIYMDYKIGKQYLAPIKREHMPKLLEELGAFFRSIPHSPHQPHRP